MENPRSGLHPLLTAAAICVTVFSAVGVATLTGLIPASMSSQREETVVQPEKGVAPTEVAPALPAPETAPKPVKKPLARVSRPRPAPQPGILATVEEVKEVTTPGEHTAVGPIAGGVAGAVLGNQFGKGNGRKVMTVLGALGGAMAGKHIERQVRGEKHWETTVRLADGTLRTVQTSAQPFWVSGERVRYVDGRLQPA